MMTAAEVGELYDLGREGMVAAFLALQGQVVHLAEEVAGLKARLDKDSHNSHKPPSSDGLKRRVKPAKPRGQTGRKPGGQAGHPGRTLKMVAQPDAVVPHEATHCAGCKLALTGPGVLVERRQVHDVPPVRLLVTEHQAMGRTCTSCGLQTVGTFPEGITPGAQYGSQLKARLVNWSTEHMIPCGRVARLAAEEFDAPISPGTVINALHQAAALAAPVVSQIKTAITATQLGHFDETGMHASKKLIWLHVASTARLSHFAVDPKRGQEAMDRIGILPAFGGIAVHDGLESYGSYRCGHQLCNAHHLRELTAIFEHTKQSWSGDIAALLRESYHHREKRGALTRLQQRRYRKRYDALIRQGHRQNPLDFAKLQSKKGRLKLSPAQNLLVRLTEHADDVLRYLSDPAIPFDNNQAERDLRMNKVKQKVSGCFRSFDTAQAFCQVRSYTSTLRKQGRQTLDVLVSLFNRHPVLPDLA